MQAVTAKLELQPCFSSWPGLSRGPPAHGLDPWASTSFGAGNEGVDTRHKAGQDDLLSSPTSEKRRKIVQHFPRTALRYAGRTSEGCAAVERPTHRGPSPGLSACLPSRSISARSTLSSRNTGTGRDPRQAWVPACERVKKLKDGLIGTARPSRQPRCGFLRMRWCLNAINNGRHGEERRRRVSNHARRPCRTGFRFETNSFTRSQAGKTEKSVSGQLR